MGKVREEVNINLQGEGIQIAFNSRYLLDVLKSMEEEEIVIELTSSVSPCVIKGKNSNNYSACGKLYYSNSGCRKKCRK